MSDLYERLLAELDRLTNRALDVPINEGDQQ